MVFAAVGDTLDVHITYNRDNEIETAIYGGTGVTGEVNRVWPGLHRRFHLDEPSERPWLAGDKKVMMEWRRRKLDEFRKIVCAIDADTISMMSGCSDFAKDVLKSSLLACIPQEIGEAFYQFYFRSIDENRQIPQEKRVAHKEIWDFLHECEPYILDNPCMIFAVNGSYMLNSLEFGPLSAYMFLDNGIDSRSGAADSDLLAMYKVHYILPALYDREEHENMLAYRAGKLFSVADYYQMATDTICATYGLKNNFMMQVCLAHEVLRDALREMGGEEEPEDWLLHTVAERVAGAVPQFSNKLVSHHVVDAYRRFVVEKEGFRPEHSLSPEGDSIFNALTEPYRGNVLVIDFWGLACAPCRSGMLDQREDVEYFKDKPVRFLYICNEKDSPREHSERFMNDNNIRGEHIYVTADEWNSLLKKFQFLGIPFHLTVDRNGRIIGRHPVFRDGIERLLAR